MSVLIERPTKADVLDISTRHGVAKQQSRRSRLYQTGLTSSHMLPLSLWLTPTYG